MYIKYEVTTLYLRKYPSTFLWWGKYSMGDSFETIEGIMALSYLSSLSKKPTFSLSVVQNYWMAVYELCFVLCLSYFFNTANCGCKVILCCNMEAKKQWFYRNYFFFFLEHNLSSS